MKGGETMEEDLEEDLVLEKEPTSSGKKICRKKTRKNWKSS